MIRRLAWLGHEITVHDPLVDPADGRRMNMASSLDPDALERQYDVVVAAVPHRAYRDMPAADIAALGRQGAWSPIFTASGANGDFPATIDRWSL